MKRSSGILLPIFSLPSPYGIGCFDSEAYRFVDFLSAAGQSYWQILPLGPTGYGDSPYQAFSTFAGNPYFIDLGEFIERGWLTREACNDGGLQSAPNRIDYNRQYRHRYPLLRQAFYQSKQTHDPELAHFAEYSPWVSDFALFMALKEAHGGAAWYTWQETLKFRHPQALEAAKADLKDSVDFHIFLQYHFYRQWQHLKDYANQKNIRIIGDIPIYVAHDSSDVWVHPQLFQLDNERQPVAVAGCPPDGFSPDGQRWGNPLYDWTYHADTGFTWWIQRLTHCFSLYDVVRIDHFRGFDEYFSIPYGDTTAHNGHWEKGPGMALFDAFRKHSGEQSIIAEDLGFMTDSVRRLVQESGFPGMRVLQFAFDLRDSGGQQEHMPHNYPQSCVAYTGTHDNQTLSAWLSTITEAEREQVRGYLSDRCSPPHLLIRSLIALLFRSSAQLCVIPMQDWLGLGDESRINIPASSEGNWQWRMSAGSASDATAKEIRYFTSFFGR